MEDLWKIYGGFMGDSPRNYVGFMEDVWFIYRGFMEDLPVVPHKAVAEVSKIGNL